MSSDIVLTAALRSNLLSLQNTQNLIDRTQLRLATGLKVNSALDDPQAFFASEGLKNRSADLSRLLDGLGQSISTIQAADQGIQSLNKLLDQAESLADEARTSLDSSSGAATIVGTTSFNLSDDLTDTSNITAGDAITFVFNDENGDVVDIDGNTDANTGNIGVENTATTAGGAEFAISDDQTVAEFITAINGLRDSDGNKVIEAKLTDDGFLQFQSLTGGDFAIEFGNTNGDTLDTGLASALGFGDVAVDEANQVTAAGAVDAAAANAATANIARISVSSTPDIKSFALYQTDGSIAKRSDTLASTVEDDLTSGVFTDTNGAAGTLAADIVVRVNGGDYISIIDSADSNTATIQDIVDGINDNANLNTSIEASYDEDTGQISIRALNADTKSFSFGFAENDNDANVDIRLDLGFGVDSISALDDGGPAASAANSTVETQNIAFGLGAGRLAQIEADFNTVRTQIDGLVEDTGYRGVNLLAGDSLESFFNEDRSNSLTVTGQLLNTSEDGLDIAEARFTDLTTVTDSLTEVRAAKTSVREFASSLATSLNILQTRQTFTTNLIETLTSGSDKLINADQNEEGANLLALQTRQQLGVTSLSLASQSQQSVLRLF